MANISTAVGTIKFPDGFSKELKQFFIKHLNKFNANTYYSFNISSTPDENGEYKYTGTGAWSFYDRILDAPGQFESCIRRCDKETQELYLSFRQELANRNIVVELIDEEAGNEMLYTSTTHWFFDGGKFVANEIRDTEYHFTKANFEMFDLNWTQNVDLEDVLSSLLNPKAYNQKYPKTPDTSLRLFGVYDFINKFLEENEYNDWNMLMNELINKFPELFDERWLSPEGAIEK